MEVAVESLTERAPTVCGSCAVASTRGSLLRKAPGRKIMGTGTRKLGFSGELVKLAAALALVVAASGFYVSNALAGDLSVQNAAPAQASAASAVGSVFAQTNTLSQPEKSVWSN